MTERYPDDATLLGLAEDAVTGVEYIATGASPYVVAFRRLVQRTLLAGQRANDLRVYQDGDLSVGVRAGRCYVGGGVREFAGASGVVVPSDATTLLWLDSEGVMVSGGALPVGALAGDRTGYVPLAEVVAGAGAIAEITDLRGEVFLGVVDLGYFGVTATGAEINQVLTGVAGTVDASALGVLTGGPASTADTEHRHLQVYQDLDGEVYYKLINDHSGVDANVGLVLSLPNQLVDDTVLLVNRGNGFLRQRYGGATYNLVGVVHVSFGHEGDLTEGLGGKLLGVVPADGVVTDVVLSVGVNMQSSVGADGVSAGVKVGGVVVTSTDPAVRSSDGSGARSTAQGDGVAGIVKADGTEVVQKGDVLTVDVTRTAGGTVSVEAGDVVVMVVVRVDGPE